MRLAKHDSTPSAVLSGDSITLDENEAYLYQGSIGAAYNKEQLQKYKITHILTCAANVQPRFQDEFEYCFLPLLDTKD